MSPQETNKEMEERFDKEFPQCDCRNNMAPHFMDSKVNRDWIKAFIIKEKQKSVEETLRRVMGVLPKQKREDKSMQRNCGWNDYRLRVLEAIKSLL